MLLLLPVSLLYALTLCLLPTSCLPLSLCSSYFLFRCLLPVYYPFSVYLLFLCPHHAPPTGDLLQHPCLRQLEQEVDLCHMCGYITLLKTGVPLEKAHASKAKRRRVHKGLRIQRTLTPWNTCGQHCPSFNKCHTAVMRGVLERI